MTASLRRRICAAVLALRAGLTAFVVFLGLAGTALAKPQPSPILYGNLWVDLMATATNPASPHYLLANRLMHGQQKPEAYQHLNNITCLWMALFLEEHRNSTDAQRAGPAQVIFNRWQTNGTPNLCDITNRYVTRRGNRIYQLSAFSQYDADINKVPGGMLAYVGRHYDLLLAQYAFAKAIYEDHLRNGGNFKVAEDERRSVGPADHYFACYMAKAPYWSTRMMVTGRHGLHWYLASGRAVRQKHQTIQYASIGPAPEPPPRPKSFNCRQIWPPPPEPPAFTEPFGEAKTMPNEAVLPWQLVQPTRAITALPPSLPKPPKAKPAAVAGGGKNAKPS